MKKIYLLILVLFLFLSCYVIYNLTDDDDFYYLSIGDNSYYDNSNKIFVCSDYRVIDLLNILKYNQEVNFNDKSISIYQLLYKADFLFISIGKNDINYILSHNSKEKFNYINKMLINLNNIFDILSKYSFKNVYFVLFDDDDIIFNYVNYRIKKLCKSYGFKFVYPNYFDKLP